MRKRHAVYRLFFRKILSRSLAFTQTQLYLTPRYPISFQRKSVKGSMTLGFSYILSKCYNLVRESHEDDLFLAILNIRLDRFTRARPSRAKTYTKHIRKDRFHDNRITSLRIPGGRQVAVRGKNLRQNRNLRHHSS